jgi:hypothetical protein
MADDILSVAIEAFRESEKQGHGVDEREALRRKATAAALVSIARSLDTLAAQRSRNFRANSLVGEGHGGKAQPRHGSSFSGENPLSCYSSALSQSCEFDPSPR